MNTSLLAKWIYKLDSDENSLALEVLKKKYLNGKSFCQSKQRGSSQFWQGLEIVREWYERGTKWKIGNWRKIRFWQDVWLGECSLKVMLEWNLEFRRRLGNDEVAEWNDL